jgi:dienelactone hydrolase
MMMLILLCIIVIIFILGIFMFVTSVTSVTESSTTLAIQTTQAGSNTDVPNTPNAPTTPKPPSRIPGNTLRTNPYWSIQNVSLFGEIPIPGTIKSLYYSGANYKGRPTRVFAYLGIPKNASSNNKVPGIVLVHGGGASAVEPWVQAWVNRGYVAISMDTCGYTPNGRKRGPKHAYSGPDGPGMYNTIQDPPTDQWPFHAVDCIIRAHTLIRDLPQVDATRIGVTGVSWGAYLTSLVVGIDLRFRFAMHVYGCGDLAESESLGLIGHDISTKQKWTSMWDPLTYIGQSPIDMLWINGAKDFAFHPNMWTKTIQKATQARNTISFRPDLRHDHGTGESVAGLVQYANAICFRGSPMPRWTTTTLNGSKAEVTFEGASKIKETQLCFTEKGNASWPSKTWQSRTIPNPDANGVVRCDVSPNWSWFIMCTTSDNSITSSLPVIK